MVLSQFINLSTTSSELREHANPVGASVDKWVEPGRSLTIARMAAIEDNPAIRVWAPGARFAPLAGSSTRARALSLAAKAGIAGGLLSAD